MTTPPTTSFWRSWPLLALLALGGCQPRNGRVEPRQRLLMHSSFEELGGWAEELPATLTTEKAHSGRFSIRLSAGHEYSPSFRMLLGRLCPTHRPRRFTLGAWVWVANPLDDAVVVLALSKPDDPEHPFFRQNVYTTLLGPFGQWRYVSRALDLPPDIHSNTQLTIYCWKSGATAPVYFDDLQLTELW